MMKRLVRVSSPLMLAGLGVGVSAGALQGCDPGVAGNVAEQCGLDIECTAGGVLEGNASVSGVRSIDAFFGAVIDLTATMRGVSGGIRAELDGIAASLDLEPGAAGADIRAAIEARLSLATSGGLTIEHEPARCEAKVEVMAAAAAECDASVDPGAVEFSCEGSCEVEAGVMVDCGASAELSCTASAPNVACDGMCTGSCEVEAGAECSGTCRGGCEGECSVENADGTCNGQCTGGACTGSCELEVAARCEGTCQGTCEYTPAEAMCEAGAEAHCEAEAGGSVQCDAGCEGKADPPSVSAECEASVEAKASASVECTPPTLAVRWDWSAELEGDLAAQAEFKAWVNGFRGRYAALLAIDAQAKLVGDAAVNLAGAAEAAVMDTASELSGEANIKASIGAACAIKELPIAATALTDTSAELSAEVSGAAEVLAVFGG